MIRMVHHDPSVDDMALQVQAVLHLEAADPIARSHTQADAKALEKSDCMATMSTAISVLPNLSSLLTLLPSRRLLGLPEIECRDKK